MPDTALDALSALSPIPGAAESYFVSAGADYRGSVTNLFVGRTLSATVALGIRSSGAAFDLQIASSEVLTANRALNIVLGDAARTLTVGANATVSGTNTGDQDLSTLAPKANPTFTGTVTIPTPFTLGAVSVLPTGTELNFVDGVTSNIQTQLDAKLALAGGTLTGALLFTDNTLDIGASGATRPRTGYFGTSVISPLFNATTGFQISGAAASRKILVGNGTNFVASTETYPVPGTSGNVMTSDGTNWTSAAGGGGSNPFDDGTALVKGSADATKLLRFEVDGFTTATTRVLTPPNADGTIAVLGLAQTWTAAQALGTGMTATSPVFTTDITTPLILSGSTSSGGTIRINTTTNGTKGFVQIDSTTSGVGQIIVGNTNSAGFFANSVPIFGVQGVTNVQIRSDGAYQINRDAGIDSFPGVGMSLIAVKVLGIGSGASGSRDGWFQWAGQARMTADATKTDTTFANLTDLTISNLQAGRKYTGRMIVKCNNTQSTEGIKFDFNGGTATMTSFWASVGSLATGGVTPGTQISTSLAGVLNFSVLTGETILLFEFSFVVNSVAGGTTIIPRFAENSTASGTVTVELGSHICLNDSPN